MKLNLGLAKAIKYAEALLQPLKRAFMNSEVYKYKHASSCLKGPGSPSPYNK